MAIIPPVFVIFTVLIFLAVNDGTTQGQVYSEIEFPNLGMVQSWTARLSSSLVSTLDKATEVKKLKQLYEDANLPVEVIDGQALVQEVATQWQSMLEKKMTAVKKIVDKLEEGFANYTYDYDIEIEDVNYLNSKNLTENLTLTYDPRFLSEVNHYNSSVQIPTDIYEGDKVILNGIRATEDVDSVFLSNFQEDPQLLWQYFGSADGFYRSYPARMFTERIDQPFDPRTRTWYIQATSSPKNVMILIDSSGSTYGMTLEIIKVSVSKALDTLGNDDFVNVAVFNDTVKYVSCFKTFVQANLRNKEVLNEAVQTKVVAGDIADFNRALNFAFDQFRDFNETEIQGAAAENQGADCIRVIMIFTDGGTSKEEALFRARNRNPFVARVFVYKVGSDSLVSSDGIKAMACSNRGYFSNIQSFGAVRLTTLDYVPVLSRPMVLSGQKNFQWSDIYLDALGLGMMTTLTLPVYNTTNNTNAPVHDVDSQQLLGVVGTDITTKNMADTVPKNKPEFNSTFNQSIGPQAYVFGINSNGYILLHPRLKAELNYLSDPPNVDFLEVEYETEEKVQLRKDMINQKSDNTTLETPIMSRDERYVERVNMTYSYRFIDNTTFSVAIAQPSFDIHQYQAPASMDIGLALKYLAQKEIPAGYHLIAPWLFCENLLGNETTNEFIVILGLRVNESENVHGLKKCDDEMVRKLLIDANITDLLVKTYWSNNKNFLSDNGFFYVLAATQGGLTVIYPEEVPVTWTPEERQNLKDPWEQSYYQRSLYTNQYVFAVPYNDGMNSSPSASSDFISNITVSKAVFLDNEVVPAVVAVMMDPVYFNDSWTLNTSQGFNNLALETSCVNPELQCFILDDGGFIIATNQREFNDDVGRFFGEIDGNIMQEMTDSGVYSLLSVFDFQAACPKQPAASNAGFQSFSIPTLNDIFSFNVWATTTFWSFLKHTLMDFFLFGWSDMSTCIHAETVEDLGNVSCIKLLKNFYYGPNTSMEASLHCGDCSRRWVASRIAGTNLLMVVTENQCETCPDIEITQSPKEPSEDEAPNPCEDVKTPRYRRRPSDNCYAFSPYENDTICSSATSLLLSWLQILFACSTTIALVLMSS